MNINNLYSVKMSMHLCISGNSHRKKGLGVTGTQFWSIQFMWCICHFWIEHKNQKNLCLCLYNHFTRAVQKLVPIFIFLKTHERKKMILNNIKVIYLLIFQCSRWSCWDIYRIMKPDRLYFLLRPLPSTYCSMLYVHVLC